MESGFFEKLGSEPVEALKLTVETYRHRETGAMHLHLASDDSHKGFLAAFKTVPEDSTGVAHVLEHTVLCGSERYPVRDPFFMMLRRSLSTFMNAFTSSDWTAYPFATLSEKDYFNLLDVYLDAAFFPRLHELDFAQEGIRVEFSTPDDPETPLEYKGVVFNEMKGAMSSPIRVLWELLERTVFPTITYRHNSGGSPERIPDLTWEQLRAFHSRHYHPSNAIFMTYGNLDLEKVQGVMQDRVLSRFQRMEASGLVSVPDERRFSEPRKAESCYAADGMGEISNKTHIVLGWLLDKSTDLETLLQAHLLNGVLLDNSSSPLLHALETTDLGTSPSSVTGLDDSLREMGFACGVEGSEPEKADDVEALILGVLEQVARDGVPLEKVEAVLHQLELSRREVSGDGLPYGLKLMLTALSPALHGGDPTAILALDGALETLRQQIQDPEFIKGLVRKLLLDNPHRVRVVLKPDPDLAATRAKEEEERLELIRTALNDEQKRLIIEQTKRLDARQKSVDDPGILPKVTLKDVPPTLSIAEGTIKPVGKMPVHWYDQPTNGLSYMQMVMEVPDLEPELLDLMPTYAACLTEVGCGKRDYMETQAWQSAISGGIASRASVRSHADDLGKSRVIFTLSSKALVRNHVEMISLMRESFHEVHFDELPRLRELIAQMRASSEMRITDNGHALAVSAACGGLTSSSALSDRWSGMQGLKRFKTLDDSLNEETGLHALAEKLTALQQRLSTASMIGMSVGEQEYFDAFAKDIEQRWPTDRSVSSPALLVAPAAGGQVRQGWMTATQVNFCAKVFPAVPITHPDAPVLMVLGAFLKNSFLHRAIREQGGAYGAMCGYDSDSGSLRFFSYRDPRIVGTLEDFDRSLEWLQRDDHPEHQLEESVLSIVSSIDRPASPSGEARRAFHNALHGRTPELRRALRQQVLNVTMSDLQRVGNRYLATDQTGIAVVGSREALESVPELKLELKEF
ncbi:MAG: insulinase family protein [Magnetococcales bacterium]|nr:insulinase family protein [Magnetococcales bacterium]